MLALPCNKYCITVYPSYTFINCHTYVSTLRFVLINMILKKKPKLHQKNLNEIQIILCSVCIIRVQNWPSFKHRFKTFDKYLTAVSYIAVFWVFFIPLALRIGYRALSSYVLFSTVFVSDMRFLRSSHCDHITREGRPSCFTFHSFFSSCKPVHLMTALENSSL